MHKLAIRWYKIYDPTSSDELTKKKTSNEKVLVKKINRPKVTFLSAIFLHQMRPSDAKSEKLFETPPRLSAAPIGTAAGHGQTRCIAQMGHTVFLHQKVRRVNLVVFTLCTDLGYAHNPSLDK